MGFHAIKIHFEILEKTFEKNLRKSHLQIYQIILTSFQIHPHFHFVFRFLVIMSLKIEGKTEGKF